MPDEKAGRAPPDEPLLSRWSRLKKEAAAAPTPFAEIDPKAEAAPIELPPVESLTPDSDFSLFMRPQVQPALRQAALKKLFTDPHFNLMDGLDIYIDDYTRPDPIAASIVAELTQFRNLDGLAQETTLADMADPETAPEDVRATAAKSLPEGPGNTSPDDSETSASADSAASVPCDIKSQGTRAPDQFVSPDSA